MKIFDHESLGILASLGSFQGVARLMGVPLKGFPAWLVWRIYYVLQMPQASRRLRIAADRILNLIFKVDMVKIDFWRAKKFCCAACANYLTQRNCALRL